MNHLYLTTNQQNTRQLTVDEIARLFGLIDWRFLLLDERSDKVYGDFDSIAMLKALTLPFLLAIESERGLAREIQERRVLRELCGFPKSRWPTRAMFWHFRKKPTGLYRRLMLRILVALVLCEDRPRFNLPFVRQLPPELLEPNPDACTTFQFNLYRPVVKLQLGPSLQIDGSILTRGKSMYELHDEVEQRIKKKRRQVGFSADLAFPAKVYTRVLADDKLVPIVFELRQPYWLDSDYRHTRQWSKDTLTTVRSDNREQQSVCHVVVIRLWQGKRQILLSQRLSGFGKGTFTLPGGKQQLNETGDACARRELKEETNLQALKTWFVNVRRSLFQDKAPTDNIGVLVKESEFSGYPKRLEPSQHSEWEWYDIDNLPQPLFKPARSIIDECIRTNFEGKPWSEFEDVSTTLEQIEQLGLELELE